MIKSLLLLFILTSCGLKITKEVNENVLIGSWELEEMKCYKVSETVPVEEYIFINQGDFVIKFDSASYNYNVSTGSCVTSSIGQYGSSSNGVAIGKLDLVNVLNSDQCSIDLLEINGAGTVTISLVVDQQNSKSREWQRINDDLRLQFFSSFNGSPIGSKCNTECKCFGLFKRI